MAKESGKTVVRRVKAADNAESVSKKTDHNTTKSAKTAGSKSKAASSVKPAAAKKATLAKAKPAKPVADSGAKPFVLFRPIFATGRYFRDSWRELRQVRWTNRRSTWAMTLAVLLFSLFFVLFILLCDWIFNFVIEEVIL